MSRIDPADVATAADLLSLLTICTITTRHIANDAEQPNELVSHLHRCIMMAEGLAMQTHHAMSVSARSRAA